MRYTEPSNFLCLLAEQLLPRCGLPIGPSAFRKPSAARYRAQHARFWRRPGVKPSDKVMKKVYIGAIRYDKSVCYSRNGVNEGGV